MKSGFIFVIVAMMLTQVIASPIPQMEYELEMPETSELEVHKIEIPEGQERVEVHHGRFRVKLNFKDEHKKKSKTHY